MGEGTKLSLLNGVTLDISGNHMIYRFTQWGRCGWAERWVGKSRFST